MEIQAHVADDRATLSDKVAFRVVLALSGAVVLLVLVLNRRLLPLADTIPAFAYRLPALNATLNGTCSVLLVISLACIRSGRVQWHRRLNLTAFVLSVGFLLSYVLFHYFVPPTYFPKSNPWRPLYLGILLTHILLAIAVLPLVLLSFRWGLTKQISRHRKIVRWSFPIWLYVTVTGVVVYLMISPYYAFPA